MYKPWSKSATPREQAPNSKGKGRGKPGGDPANKALTNNPSSCIVDANWSTFCKKCMSCEGRRPPHGDGSCKKIHLPEEEAKEQITRWKEAREKQSAKEQRPGTPRSSGQ